MAAKAENKPDLVFITTTEPKIKEPSIRTAIRKHVMRDIGKARRNNARHKWNKPVQMEFELHSDPAHAHPLAPPDQIPTGSISRFSAGRGDPFIRYPIEMNFRDLALLDHGQSPVLVSSSKFIPRS